MRIGIDARMYGFASQGLGRYAEKLIESLSQIDTKTLYHIFVMRGTRVRALPSNFKIVETSCKWYSFSEQLAWPFQLYREKLDLMHFTHFNVPVAYLRPYVVTVHDLILLRFPTTHASTRHPLFFRLKYLAYRMVLRHAIKSAKAIIAVSGFTAQDIQRHFPGVRKKIKVIYEAPGVQPTSSADAIQYGNDEAPYILYVGNAYPHKNLEYLTREFSVWQNSHPKHRLRLVGKRDYFYDRLARTLNGSQSPVDILFDTTDSDLEQLYRRASAFVFPSLYEGFGLPALEAFAFNIPVLAADRGSLPEILGSAALYFNPDVAEDFRNKLSTILFDEELREKLRQAGQIRYKKFSWAATALETRALYGELQNEYNRAVPVNSYVQKKRTK